MAALRQSIDVAYRVVSKRLLEVMMDNYKLMDHLYSWLGLDFDLLHVVQQRLCKGGHFCWVCHRHVPDCVGWFFWRNLLIVQQ